MDKPAVSSAISAIRFAFNALDMALFDAPAVAGPRGATGPAGPQGLVGVTGPTGPTGPVGGTTPAPGPTAPPPPPATGAHTGLYVQGATLHTKNGTPIILRGIESIHGATADIDPSDGVTPANIADLIVAFGANTWSPLFEAGTDSPAEVQAVIAAGRARGLVVGVNADHTTGRAWATSPAIVAILNAADNVFLECEVELGTGLSQAAFVAYAKAFIDDIAAAGIRCPVKVGTEQGGRVPQYVLAAGAELVAYAATRGLVGGLLFTWQAYWKTGTSGWQYSQNNGSYSSSAGTAGALECAAAIRASGLCFLVGLDYVDNIGATPWAALADAFEAGGVSWQYWALSNDGMGNNLVDYVGATSQLAVGAAVKAKFLAQPHPIAGF